VGLFGATYSRIIRRALDGVRVRRFGYGTVPEPPAKARRAFLFLLFGLAVVIKLQLQVNTRPVGLRCSLISDARARYQRSACDPRRCAIVAFTARSPRVVQPTRHGNTGPNPHPQQCRETRDAIGLGSLFRELFPRRASLVAPRLRMGCIRLFGWEDDRPCYPYYN